uniref:Prefoldin subunit 1 n=1 Tax=Acrobeloides nanus TaxID=290746 RepID=A0A914CAI8_9BILA
MTTEDFDGQLRKAFQDLQMQMIDTKEKLHQGDSTKHAMKQNIRIAELVKEHLSTMNEDRPVYRSVGRVFLLETVESEIKRQDEDIRVCTERIATLDRQKDYLQKSLAEAEKNLREMVQLRRS